MRAASVSTSIVVLVLAQAALPSASHAAIVETIIDTDTDTPVGSITFPALTGSTDAGVLFSMDGFTQTNIVSISWSLAPITYAVNTLDLYAVQRDNPCPNDHLDCSNSTLSLSASSASQASNSCFFSPRIGICETAESEPESISLVLTSVPEPSTWAMMLLGFAGLGYFGYRTRRARLHATV